MFHKMDIQVWHALADWHHLVSLWQSELHLQVLELDVHAGGARSHTQGRLSQLGLLLDKRGKLVVAHKLRLVLKLQEESALNGYSYVHCKYRSMYAVACAVLAVSNFRGDSSLHCSATFWGWILLCRADIWAQHWVKTFSVVTAHFGASVLKS